MRSYARLDEDNIFVELFKTELDISEMFTPCITWIEITGTDARVGQVYESSRFSDVVASSPTLSKQDVEVLRRTAYADPVLGSDRYFSEVLSLQAEGFAASSVEVKDVKTRGLARKVEIQTLYPYPAE